MRSLSNLGFTPSVLGLALVASCQDGASPTEVISVTFTVSQTVAGLTFPQIRLSVSATGTSSLGNAVTVTSITVGGNSFTTPGVVTEGDHQVCATVASSSEETATSCRTESLRWPRIFGRAVRWTAGGASVPSGVSLVVQDTLDLAITSDDGSFEFPSAIAELSEVKMRFQANAVAPALVRASARQAVGVVLLPNPITIPSCSVHRGTVVLLDLERAYRRSSATNTSYFDRANTHFNANRIVVASWNTPSIGVALSDTGAASKRFTPEDTAEVLETLQEMSGYFCQVFHLTSVSEATTNGVVLHKDPLFPALGAHSMALPASRGDYERAVVVVRRVAPVEPASRDTIRRTIMHEFLHVLGFGHSCSWPTVMTTGTICEDPLRALKPSPEDVAHYFAMRWAREGERSLGTTWSLSNAFAADAIARGLPEPAVRPYFTQP